MKTYRLGTVGDRVVTVKKSGGEHVVTIRRDCDSKYIQLPPKRQVFILKIYFILNSFVSLSFSSRNHNRVFVFT